MMISSLSLLQWIAIIGCAAAQNAYLYNIDIKPRPQQAASSVSASIDSDTATAILTRRLGAAESTKLGYVDDIVLEHLNNYGGQGTLRLFGDEASSSIPDRLVIAIEGYDGEPVPGISTTTIQRANTDLATFSFFEDLIARDSTGASTCIRHLPSNGGMYVTYIVDSKGGPCSTKADVINMLARQAAQSSNVETKAMDDTFNNLAGGGSRAFIKVDMTRMAKTSPEAHKATLKTTFTEWYLALEPLAEAGKVESTILLLPSQRAPPNLNLNRRQTTREEDEEPLSQPFVSTFSSESSSTPSDTTPSNSTHAPRPLGSFLPACFPTINTCQNRTNMCSGGHGSCYAKSRNCFACKCGSTIVRQDSDGKNVKTVQWGGTACERKDVSVPFFLFAGFGIFMSAVVVGAIGMMYSMGSEELPSVIGAGVTGPRAQR